MLTLTELGVFVVACSSVAACTLLLLRRFGLRIRRRLGCSCGGRGGKGKRWQGLAGDDDYGNDDEDDDAYDEEAGDFASIMRVVVQLSAEDEADEVELELTGLRHIADVKAAIASMYSEPGDEITLARQLVVQCDDDERGLTVALPGKTPVSQLMGVDHLLVKRRGKGDAVSEVGSTLTERKMPSAAISDRAAPASCSELHDLAALAARGRGTEQSPAPPRGDEAVPAGGEAEAATEVEPGPEPEPEPELAPDPDTPQPLAADGGGEATGAVKEAEEDGMGYLDALAKKIAERQGAAELAAQRSME